MKKRNRILIIEPYYGGSHRAFLDGLLKKISCDHTVLTLPARKWKMRMQLSAPWFVAQVKELSVEKRYFDTVLCSTFLDVAVLRSMLSQLNGWNQNARFCTYFHENQFAYPGQVADTGMLQFAAMNYTTAMVSDSVAFNSTYNMMTFLEQSRQYVKKATDMCLLGHHDGIAQKSVVLHPGIDFGPIDQAPEMERDDEPVILWNHRWEHDKNPEAFFSALRILAKKGVQFKLVLLGESFKNQPQCFRKAREFFADRILHYGYAESREEYAVWLKKADITVSTAVHEFFGIAVLEAVRAGGLPVLPNRLSYPELFPDTYLYDDGNLANRLESVLSRGERLSAVEARQLTEHHSWDAVKDDYREWLFG